MIEKIRHSLSHIMALSVKELHPSVKFGMGPAIENGFYYDFEFQKPISTEDLQKIEKRMRENLKKDISFKKKNVTKIEARKLFKDQPYKLELMEELPGKTVSLYQSGDFTDLCKGPHVKSTKDIPADAFKLTRIAGAYWKGSENNQMLTRIYGIAFETKKELQEHIEKEKEAEKRDHRKLGQELDLFHIDEKVGPGLILWHPKGASLKKTIMDRVIKEYLNSGYQLIETPHIAKLNLWNTSGHSDFYKESMLPPMRMKEIDKKEKDDYQIKPMNCPFHISIFKDKMRSYKELPVRFTEMGTVYRYEKSGTLHGLVRVRGFTQDDAHIFCTPEQLSEEILSAVKLAQKILKETFKFKDLDIYVSTKPKKYVGDLKIWEKAEKALKQSLEKIGLKYSIDEGGGAFYGPKIDIKIKDSIGRLWQCSTIQVDFNLPERFDISYVDEKGKEQKPILIHRAILGSLERFIGILLEYHGGDLSVWPAWLSPIQLLIIFSNDLKENIKKQFRDQLIIESAKEDIREENIDFDDIKEKGEISKKNQEFQKRNIGKLNIPYCFMIGPRELSGKIYFNRKEFISEKEIDENRDLSAVEKRIIKVVLRTIKKTIGNK